MLSKGFPWREALVQPNPGSDLFILPAGPGTWRAPDLVGKGLPQLLEEAAEEFDLIILDAAAARLTPSRFKWPPRWTASSSSPEPATNRTAVATLLHTLNRLRATVIGVVLNEVHKEMSHSYYYYGYYGKYYRDRGSDTGMIPHFRGHFPETLGAAG